MTYREKLAQDRPDIKDPVEYGCCPCVWGYESSEETAKACPNFVVCAQCWDREMPDKNVPDTNVGHEQEAKADAGKPRLTLVPTQIIWDVAEVREYGTLKYHDPDNWKQVEAQRYRDAAYRHFLAYIRDPESVDEESGIKHRKHLECKLAFLAEMEDGQ